MNKSMAALKHERDLIDAKIIKANEAVAKLTPAQRMAIEVHNLSCKLNHTDHCSWGHGDIVKNPLDVHIQYLKKAEQLIAKGYSLDQVGEILFIANGD